MKSEKSRRVPVVIVLIFLLPIVGYLIATGLGGFGTFRLRQHAAEAKFNVRALARSVVRRHEQEKEWRAAGPTPKEIPGEKPVPFPEDADFAALGFAPGEVYYQYQVEVLKDGDRVKTVRAVAHGDLDGDGQVSTFQIWVNPVSREIGQIEIESELE